MLQWQQFNLCDPRILYKPNPIPNFGSDSHQLSNNNRIRLWSLSLCMIVMYGKCRGVNLANLHLPPPSQGDIHFHKLIYSTSMIPESLLGKDEKGAALKELIRALRLHEHRVLQRFDIADACTTILSIDHWICDPTCNVHCNSNWHNICIQNSFSIARIH